MYRVGGVDPDSSLDGGVFFGGFFFGYKCGMGYMSNDMRTRRQHFPVPFCP